MIRRNLSPAIAESNVGVQERRKSWFNILFLSLTPVIGVFGTMTYNVPDLKANRLVRWQFQGEVK